MDRRQNPNELTYGTLVRQRVEHIQRGNIPLLVSPNEVDPLRQMFTDIVALQRSSVHNDEEQRVVSSPWWEVHIIDMFARGLQNTKVEILVVFQEP